jgi:hypothetical protein
VRINRPSLLVESCRGSSSFSGGIKVFLASKFLTGKFSYRCNRSAQEERTLKKMDT